MIAAGDSCMKITKITTNIAAYNCDQYDDGAKFQIEFQTERFNYTQNYEFSLRKF